MRRSQLKANTSTEGETIEQKVERVVNNKEPLGDGSPLIYTERKDGVKASFNVRTDKREIAIEASEKIAKSYLARRDERQKSTEIEPIETKPQEGDESPNK